MTANEFTIKEANNILKNLPRICESLSDSPKSLMNHLCQAQGKLNELRDFYKLVIEIEPPQELFIALSAIEEAQDKI